MALRDKIKAASDVESEVVDVPQWDVKIEVRNMTGLSRARLLKKATNEDGDIDLESMYPAILVASCYDPDEGTAVFEAEDSSWINDKSAGPIERLAQVALRLSGLDKDSIEAGKGGS